MKLDQLELKERIILANQYLILDKLFPNQGYIKLHDVLQHGYVSAYSELAGSFSEEMPIEDCEFVRDVLAMYHMLRSAYNGLSEPDKSGIDHDLEFPGFDGNNEGQYYGYAKFLLERPQLAGEPAARRLNSHMPMTQTYRSMLEKWDRCPDKFNLTKDDILNIIAR